MEIILKQKVENLGSLGDVVRVKSGYARNYLVPYNKAIYATKENIELFKVEKAKLEAEETARFEQAKITATQLKGKKLKITSPAGESGKLFGSVGSKDIVDAITEQCNVTIEKRQVRLPEGVIRQIGEFPIDIHVYSGLDITIVIEVVAQ